MKSHFDLNLLLFPKTNNCFFVISDDDDDDADEEDDTEALLAELQQIKKERAEEMLQKVNFLKKSVVSHGASILHDLNCLYEPKYVELAYYGISC